MSRTRKRTVTQDDVTAVLAWAPMPWTTGEIIHRLALHLGVRGVDSVQDAVRHVSRANVVSVLGEMAVAGTLVRKTGAEWRWVLAPLSFSDTAVYYYLAETLEEHTKANEHEAAKRREGVWRVRAHGEAQAALVSAHQEEYREHYDRILRELREGEPA